MKWKWSSVMPGETADSPRVPTGWPGVKWTLRVLCTYAFQRGRVRGHGELYTWNLSGVSRLPCTPQKCTTQVQMFRQAVWCRKHKAGNRGGLCVAKGAPPAKPLSSCSVFISWHRRAKDAVHSYQKVCFFFFALNTKTTKISL